MEGETRFRAMGTDVHVMVVGGRVTLLELGWTALTSPAAVTNRPCSAR